MRNVMVAGAGKIGSLIACLLMESQRYHVHLVDSEFAGADAARLLKRFPHIQTMVLDVTDKEATRAYLEKNKIGAVISSLPYFLNIHVAHAANEAGTHYFDLTEDIKARESVANIAKDSNVAFVPQCGLAPGFISIVAHSLMQEFDVCHHVKLRVGALPQCTSNALHYSLTWSTDGLINEYGNLCDAIEDGQRVLFTPLEGLETIQIEGAQFEAFHTSGGLGGSALLYEGQLQTLNYKTIRYPGHCEKMRFLMETLKLNDDRDTLKRILERAMPKTYQDMVIIYVSVEGMRQGELVEKSYVKKILPAIISELEWSAIQVSTASSVCAAMDLILKADPPLKGLIAQEHFQLTDILSNHFGRFYA